MDVADGEVKPLQLDDESKEENSEEVMLRRDSVD